jgi:hypothetical protein
MRNWYKQIILAVAVFMAVGSVLRADVDELKGKDPRRVENIPRIMSTLGLYFLFIKAPNAFHDYVADRRRTDDQIQEMKRFQIAASKSPALLEKFLVALAKAEPVFAELEKHIKAMPADPPPLLREITTPAQLSTLYSALTRVEHTSEKQTSPEDLRVSQWVNTRGSKWFSKLKALSEKAVIPVESSYNELMKTADIKQPPIHGDRETGIFRTGVTDHGIPSQELSHGDMAASARSAVTFCQERFEEARRAHPENLFAPSSRAARLRSEIAYALRNRNFQKGVGYTGLGLGVLGVATSVGLGVKNIVEKNTAINENKLDEHVLWLQRLHKDVDNSMFEHQFLASLKTALTNHKKEIAASIVYHLYAEDPLEKHPQVLAFIEDQLKKPKAMHHAFDGTIPGIALGALDKYVNPEMLRTMFQNAKVEDEIVTTSYSAFLNAAVPAYMDTLFSRIGGRTVDPPTKLMSPHVKNNVINSLSLILRGLPDTGPVDPESVFPAGGINPAPPGGTAPTSIPDGVPTPGGAADNTKKDLSPVTEPTAANSAASRPMEILSSNTMGKVSPVNSPLSSGEMPQR